MTERAEGFWWVRYEVDGGGGWAVVGVHAGVGSGGDVVLWPGLDSPPTATIVEWGPYLGKEPGEERKRVADWVRSHAHDGAFWLDSDDGPASLNEYALADAIEHGESVRFDVKPEAVYKSEEPWDIDEGMGDRGTIEHAAAMEYEHGER